MDISINFRLVEAVAEKVRMDGKPTVGVLTLMGKGLVDADTTRPQYIPTSPTKNSS